MGPSDCKAVPATVFNAGKYVRPSAICLGIHTNTERDVCGFALARVCVCVRDRLCTLVNGAASARELGSLQSFHIKRFNGRTSASEVFILNPVHNLMAFESLPRPPG